MLATTLAIATGVSISVILSFPLMLLWNGCLVPAIGINEVGFFQMWGIMILVNCLTGGK